MTRFIGAPGIYSVGRVNPAVLVYCLAKTPITIIHFTSHRGPHVLLGDHEEREHQEDGGGDKPVQAEYRAIDVNIGDLE